MVQRVGHVDHVAVVDGDAGGQLKLSRAFAAGAEVVQQVSGRVKNLNCFKQSVDDVKIAVGVGGDALGTVQSSRVIPNLSERAHELAVRGERLDAKIHRINDVHFARGECE